MQEHGLEMKILIICSTWRSPFIKMRWDKNQNFPDLTVFTLEVW